MQAAKKVATVLSNKKLSATQVLTLMAVAENPGATTGELAATLKANPLRIAERLGVLGKGSTRSKGKGLIKTVQPKGAGHRSQHNLTATGRRVIEQLKKAG